MLSALRRRQRNRRAILAAGAAALIGLALWIRNVAEQAPAAGPGSAATVVTRQLRDLLVSEVAHLDAAASDALNAPPQPEAALEFLAPLPNERVGESLVLFDSSGALAWAGHVRTSPDTLTAPLSVTFGAFFTTVSVTRIGNRRRAVASGVIAAAPPADRLTGSLLAEISGSRTLSIDFTPAPPSGVASRPGADVGPLLELAGKPLLFAAVAPALTGEPALKRAALLGGRAAMLLLAGYLVLLIAGSRSRRDLGARLVVVAAGLIITGIFPWSAFSNSSRLFDPGNYFARFGGPWTASAGPLLATAVLILVGVFALLRARLRIRLSRGVATGAAVLTAGAGASLAFNIARGIGQPASGATPALFLYWEISLFLFLFVVMLGIVVLVRAGSRASPGIPAAAVGWIAIAAGAMACLGLWSTTAAQRRHLAERDAAALTRVDSYERILVTRFIESVQGSRTPRDAAELLRAYSASELSGAEYPVFLQTTAATGARIATLDLAPGAVDTLATLSVNRGAPSVTSVLGPSGVQLVATARHSGGETTTAIALPHTRLVEPLPFASLIGLRQAATGEPPYTLTLAEVSPSVPASQHGVEWHRIGDIWHGDRLIPTSAGIRRAHLEVDLRSFSARAQRGFLIVILDALLAGIVWLLLAAAERPFARWLRVRAVRWLRTYRGRLTIALFAFFVVPATAFALWSYQRLRGDDRQTRELLVFGTLQTIGSGADRQDLAAAADRFDTPLFRYAGGFLNASSDSLYGSLPPGGLALPPAVHRQVALRGEAAAAWQQQIAGSDMLFGYRTVLGANEERYVLAAPARGDDLLLDRRRRDLGILLLFLTGLGGAAAFWLSGIAAKRLARDLELSRIEVARAERVIAWGEMARQVAHEIKNPLTPIRLGVQHLRRARSAGRPDFDRLLDENAGRILAEIDRLDAIARSFSRYGSAPADLPPAERTDVAAIARDVVALEQIGQGVVTWKLRGGDQPLAAMARGDELRDVLLNLLENARLAGAHRVDIELREEERRVTIEVCDDGAGIPRELLPRIFEPHFSTRTTGSGLGLPASRRIIEHWGGEIVVSSQEGKGARVLVALPRPTS